jgi:hypothetical protein
MRRRGALVLVLAVCLLLAVALGTRGGASGSAAIGMSTWQSALYVLVGVAAGAIAALLLVAAVDAVLHRRHRRPEEREPRPIPPLYMVLVLGAVVLAAMWLALHLPRSQGTGLTPKLVGRARVVAASPAAPTASLTPLLVGLVVGIAAVALGALMVLMRARSRPPLPLVTETPSPPLEEVVDAALEALGSETDPRRAVIAAYATMERLLAAAGSPRRPADAPTEHLERSLVLLGAGRASAHRLTELFERARFSVHVIDEQVRRAAVDALAAVRRDLEPA